jgi:ATP-dependent metalloprotease
MLGLLRIAARPAAGRPPRLPSQPSASQFCTLRPFQPRHTSLAWTQHYPTRFFTPPTSRNLSLGSIFSRKPTPSPTPLVVAHITRLEAEANVHPHDVEKQLALFHALLETKIKTSYDLIINRWERMCEFVCPRNFLQTPVMFNYLSWP